MDLQGVVVEFGRGIADIKAGKFTLCGLITALTEQKDYAHSK